MNILPFFPSSVCSRRNLGNTDMDRTIPVWLGPYHMAQAISYGTSHNFMYISYLKDCTILFPSGSFGTCPDILLPFIYSTLKTFSFLMYTETKTFSQLLFWMKVLVNYEL